MPAPPLAVGRSWCICCAPFGSQAEFPPAVFRLAACLTPTRMVSPAPGAHHSTGVRLKMASSRSREGRHCVPSLDPFLVSSFQKKSFFLLKTAFGRQICYLTPNAFHLFVSYLSLLFLLMLLCDYNNFRPLADRLSSALTHKTLIGPFG